MAAEPTGDPLTKSTVKRMAIVRPVIGRLLGTVQSSVAEMRVAEMRVAECG